MTNLANNPRFKNETWMTTADAMAYLKVSRRTLQRWCADKQIPFTFIGGTKYYPKEFIDHLLQLKMNQSLAEEADE
jgi:excisionase family DNA binding protein